MDSNINNVEGGVQKMTIDDAMMELDPNVGKAKAEEEEDALNSSDVDADYVLSDQDDSDDNEEEDISEDHPEAEALAEAVRSVLSVRRTKRDLIESAIAGFEVKDRDVLVSGVQAFRKLIEAIQNCVPRPTAEQVVALVAMYGTGVVDDDGNFALFEKTALVEDYMEIVALTSNSDALERALEQLDNILVEGVDGQCVSINKLAKALKLQV